LTSWKIEVKPAAEKHYLKLDKRMRARIKQALYELEQEDNPVGHPDVRALTGKLHGDYRLRVGGRRILFTPDKEKKIIYVYAILTRGDAY
jgi:mRNA-degrading endonuclease RelE of RelBE toxin-antitoxin system